MVEGQRVDLGIDGLTDEVEVGHGGFAVVYRARQTLFDRLVAVKVLNGGVAHATQAAFERECRTIGRLSGRPNILNVHDAGITPSGRPYLIMAYMAGGSLEDRLGKGALPWRVVADIGIKLAGALERAHQEGVLHRDVKPGNVLLSADAEPQLADFGIARLVDANRATQSTPAFTPVYVAPEVVQGHAHTRAADVYSLAATMFALIVGHPAFENHPGDSVGAILARVTNDPVPNLMRPLGVPEAVCAAIERAMAKDPAARPASAAAFAHQLQAATGSTAPVPAAPRLWQRARRHLPLRDRQVRTQVLANAIGGLIVAVLIASAPPAWKALSSPTAHTNSTTNTRTPPTTSVFPPFPPGPTDTASTTLPTTGLDPMTIVGRVPASRDTTGFTWDGTFLWTSDRTGAINKLDRQGKTIAFYRQTDPRGGAAGPPLPPSQSWGIPEGIVWASDVFYVHDLFSGSLNAFTVNGAAINIHRTFQSPGAVGHALGWDGKALWLADRDKILRLSPTGDITDSYTAQDNVTGFAVDGAVHWLSYSGSGSGPIIERRTQPGGDRHLYACPLLTIYSLGWVDHHLWALGQEKENEGLQFFQLNVP